MDSGIPQGLTILRAAGRVWGYIEHRDDPVRPSDGPGADWKGLLSPGKKFRTRRVGQVGPRHAVPLLFEIMGLLHEVGDPRKPLLEIVTEIYGYGRPMRSMRRNIVRPIQDH